MKNSQTDHARTSRGIRIKQRIKSAVFCCLYYTGLEWLLARLIPVDAAAVLMYHGVSQGSPIPAHINFHLEPDVFERQMRVLASRYRVVPLADVVTAMARGAPISKSVVLTFDDGYQNNARYVAPVLNSLRLPFTVFVATSYVDSGCWMPLNEIYWLWAAGELNAEEMNDLRRQVRGCPAEETGRILDALRGRRRPVATAVAEESFAMLSWDQIREMAGAGAEFGSHTHSHCNMAAESPSQQSRELSRSKQLLESRLERSVHFFAYPYGRAAHMSETARHNIIAAGYECAVSAEYGVVTGRSDRFCLPRLGYDRRIWMYAGEIMYQFAKQAAKDAWSKVGRIRTGRTSELHG